MSSTGLLVVSNIKNISISLTAIKEYVKSVLYIHLNVNTNNTNNILPSWSSTIMKIYGDSLIKCPEIDVRVLVSSLKTAGCSKLKNIDVLLLDHKSPKLCEEMKKRYGLDGNRYVYLNEQNNPDIVEIRNEYDPSVQVYDNVVLGGTFDRIHMGHKIMLTEAVLRARKKVVVGVTDTSMIKSKRLSELILPVEQRISDVCEFLNQLDCTLHYEVVPIQDPFGPTRTDPDMDLIIVSAETMKGGLKVNQLRLENGLKPLEIHCIPMFELQSGHKQKEVKISSSNTRLDLLGTRLRKPEVKLNLPDAPYIIGLTGGIASGKSIMSERFKKYGASIIDCDKLAHEIYQPGQECYKKIVNYFGETILDEDRTINRKKLGNIVFDDSDKLRKLNEIVWPDLIIRAKEKIQELYEKERASVVILEAALLFEAGWEKECHEVWSMIIPRKEAVERLKNRNNLSEEEASKRISSQLDNEYVVNNSNIVFSSEWTYEFSEEQAKKAWDALMNRLKHKQ